MSQHCHHYSGNESRGKSDFKMILNEIQALRINTELRFVLVVEELKTLRKKEEKLKTSTSRRTKSGDERIERNP